MPPAPYYSFKVTTHGSIKSICTYAKQDRKGRPSIGDNPKCRPSSAGILLVAHIIPVTGTKAERGSSIGHLPEGASLFLPVNIHSNRCYMFSFSPHISMVFSELTTFAAHLPCVKEIRIHPSPADRCSIRTTRSNR